MSGNGQVTQQYFNTTQPLVVEARDGNGNLMANLPLTWAVVQGYGTIVSPPERTDAQGRASAYFRGDVIPGYTFSQQTVQVSSSVGSVNFVITTNINRLPNGSTAEYPLVELLTPSLEDRSLTGRSGGTLPGAIRVGVVAQSGLQSGVPVPNVGLRIVDPQDLSATPAARCAGQPMTDTQGIGQCDLVITGGPGTYLIAVGVGEFRITPGIFLRVLAGASCTYAVTASSQQFAAAAGIGTVSVATPAGCDWTAVSNSSWITITSGSNGNGAGGVAFSVPPNAGAARSGSITVAGHTLAISQAGVGGGLPSSLQIVTSASLASGTVGTPYTAVLGATGGRTPYVWIGSGALPPGLTLNTSTGTISGTPTAAGTFSTPITVTDAAGASQSQTVSITIIGSSGGTTTPPPASANPAFLTTSFPNAAVGALYQQVLTSAGGCASPFTAPAVVTLTGGSLPSGLALKTINDRTYAISGTPSVAGTFSFTLTVTDPCGKSGTATFTLVVTGTGTGPGPGTGTGPFSASPQALSFTLATGGAGIFQELPLTVNGPAGTSFFAVTTVTGGGSWLSETPSSGVFPQTVTVRAAGTGALSNGTYTGTVTFISNAGNLSVPVTLTVGGGSSGGTPPPAASLVVAPGTINYTAQAGGSAISQPVTITNASGVVRYSVQASTVTGGTWLTVNQTSGDTPANIIATLNPAGLPPSIYTGAIVVTPVSPAGAAQTIPVTLRVLPPAALAITPANLLFASQPGTPPQAPQTLTIQSTGAAFDATVSTTTSSGGNWLFTNTMQGTTPINAAISVNAAGLAPGTYQGAVMVTPAAAGITPIAVPVTLTVAQAGPSIAAISNGASFLPGPVAPGEIVTIFGSDIGPSTLAPSRVSAGRLDSLIGETRVYFDDIPAPLIYSSVNQISAIVPYGVDGRATTKVSVEYRGVRSSPVELGVVASAPAIFTAAPSGQAAALNQDGGINSTQNGALPGEVVVLFATGEGQTNPGGSDGKLATEVFPKPVLPVTVRVNGQIATVLYAGAAPTLAAGLMQINVLIPLDTPRGVSVPVVLEVGQTASQAGVTVAIKP